MERGDRSGVARAGAGLVVKPRKLGRLEGALQEALADGRFTEAAARIAREAAALDGPVRAAELVETLGARKPGTAHTRNSEQGTSQLGNNNPSVDVPQDWNL